MRFGERHRAGVEVSEWLNGTEFDKTVAVDVFDGTYPNMTLTGGAYLDNSTGMVRPALAGNYASVSDSSALSVTGDIDIMCRLKMDDWSPAGQTFLLSKGSGGAAGSYILGLSGSGSKTLQFYASPNGSTYSISAISSTVGVPFNDGDYGWVRATLDVNDGAGSYQLKFYTAADESGIPSSWTQLGTTRTGTATSIFDGTGELRIMEIVQSSASVLRRVVIKNGYDGAGSTVFDADFTVPAYGARSFTESSSNAATVTIASTANWTGTWSKPAGATMVRVLCIGSGGGGGSGYKGAAGITRGGGSSGGGGGASLCEFEAKELPSSVTVAVVAGGIGGAGVTVNSTQGNSGGNGASTTFGSYCGAGGGGFGGGGLDSGGGSFASGGVGLVTGGLGQQRNFSTTPNELTGTTEPSLFTSGGTSGGTISTGNIAGTAGLHATGRNRSSMPLDYFPSVGGRGSNASTTGNSNAGGSGICGGGGGGSGAVVNDVGNSGPGGFGGNGCCVVVSYRDCDIQGFTASGTWNKPVGNYSVAKIFVVGAGGGGGSGRRGAAGTDRGGGDGGSGGGISMIEIPFSSLASSVTVTVGLGGTGGAGQAVDDSNGNNGNVGGQSSFGTLLTAFGGEFGRGAGQTGWATARTALGASYPGGTSGAGSLASVGGAGAGATSYSGGGGAGGAINASNTNRGGGAGGVGAAYTSAVTAATAGNNGPTVYTGQGFFAGNGAGGGSAPGGSGGNGAPKGGGAGGGSASVNGATSGAGGNGGNGYVCVVCI